MQKRSSKKESHLKNDPTPESALKLPWKRLVSVLIPFALAAIPFIYGKYIEFNTPGAFDGALYVYDANQVVQGKLIGKEVAPTARPATLLTNMVGVWLFGYSELGPKVLQTLMQIVALILMYITLCRIYGRFPAAIALILAASFLSCPPFAKYGNVKEQFMIACMVISVCSLLLWHKGGSIGWLLVSGIFAVNICYYKPTGASAIVGMAVYLILQPLFRLRTIKQFFLDIGGLLLGAIIGVLPLFILFASHGQLIMLLGKTPGGLSLIRAFKEKPATAAKPTLGGRYIKTSRSVSNYESQFNTVFRYYKSFIVPIGMSLLAIGFGLVGSIRAILLYIRGKKKSDEPPDEEKSDYQSRLFHGSLILLFGIWWILDMCFIWVSPRSYVEYYLPLNSSAAMLTASAVWLMSKRQYGILILLGMWFIIELLFTGLAPVSTFPYISFEFSRFESLGSSWIKHLIIFALAITAFFLLKRKLSTFRPVVLVVLCLVSAYFLNTANLATFQKRYADVHRQKSQNHNAIWVQISKLIKDNSTPEDSIYVWGWYPGIYVESQRVSAARRPAYSNMHSEKPVTVGRHANSLVQQFEKNKPKFIVDSQKMHFPFWDHPVMDLWPRWSDSKKRSFSFNYGAAQAVRKSVFMHPDEWQAHHKIRYEHLKQVVKQLLKRKKLPKEQVEKLAEQEQQRHMAIKPLRDYMMKYYKPISKPSDPMLVFQRVK